MSHPGGDDCVADDNDHDRDIPDWISAGRGGKTTTTKVSWSAQTAQPDADEVSIDEAPGGTHLYHDYTSGRSVPDRLRHYVDAIVNDSRYHHPDGDDDLVHSDHAGELEHADFEVVAGAAYHNFKYTIGRSLEQRANEVVAQLAARDDVNPYHHGRELREWVAERVTVTEDPRIVAMVQWKLPRVMKPARLNAERDAALRASELVSTLDAPTRDQLGFARQRVAREELLEEHLRTVTPEYVRGRVAELARSLEESQHGKRRERRFATAARALLARGASRSVVSRKLGISSSVTARLLTTHPKNVRLAEDDYLRELT